MKRYLSILVTLGSSLVVILLLTGLAAATPESRPLRQGGAPTVISYQGIVTVDSVTYDGTGYFKFAVVGGGGTTSYWSNDGSSTGGDAPSGAVELDVVDGLFSVLLGDTSLTNMSEPLDAAVFDGPGRYLRVWFSSDGVSFTRLSPDRQFAAVPYALQAEEAKNAWQLGGNAGTTPGVDMLGTTDDTSLTLGVDGSAALRLEPDATSPNLIGGNEANWVTPNVRGAVIGGGGTSTSPNGVTDHFGVVSGGRNNQAGDGDSDLNGARLAFVGGGSDNVANGYYSAVVGGEENWAGQVDFVGGGLGNIVTGTASLIVGGWGNIITDTSPVQHWASHFWYNAIVGGERNAIVGDGVNWSIIGGGDHNEIVGVNASVIGGGRGNVITGTQDVITIGGGEYNEASGDRSTIGGGDYNVASGGRSTVGGGTGNEAAGGYASTIAGGFENTAAGNSSTVGGGRGNVAEGTRSTVPGGSYAAATHYGEQAYASGDFTEPGDAQSSLYVLRRSTAGASTAQLYLDGSDERITLPVSRTMTFDILLTAAADNGDAASYHYTGGIKRTSAGTSLIGATVELLALEDDPSWAVTIDAYSDGLRVRVTGAADRTIHWVASVRTAETVMP